MEKKDNSRKRTVPNKEEVTEINPDDIIIPDIKISERSIRKARFFASMNSGFWKLMGVDDLQDGKIRLTKEMVLFALAFVLCIMLAGCGGSKDSSVTTAAADTTDTEPYEEETDPIVIDTSWYAKDNTAICEGVYIAGKDIAAGNYIFTCTESQYGMELLIFESEEKYLEYHKTSRFTVGEESDAREAYASEIEYLGRDYTYAVNLKDGAVLMLLGGRGTMRKADGSDEPAPSIKGGTMIVSNGTYNAGDIPEGHYMLTCTDTTFNMSIVAFEDKAAYDAYLAADHFTVGEESAAIEQNALYDIYIYAGESACINVRTGMVFMFDYGTGQLEPVNLSWEK